MTSATCARSRARLRRSRRTRGTAPGIRPAGRSRAARRGPRSSGKSVSKSASRRARTFSRSSMLFAVTHELREVRLRELLVERQVEARRAAADVGRRSSRCPVPASSTASSFCAARHRRRERAAFRQPQVDEQLDARRRGKELLRHQPEQAERADEDGERRREHHLAMRDAPGDRRRAGGRRTASRYTSWSAATGGGSGAAGELAPTNARAKRRLVHRAPSGSIL